MGWAVDTNGIMLLEPVRGVREYMQLKSLSGIDQKLVLELMAQLNADRRQSLQLVTVVRQIPSSDLRPKALTIVEKTHRLRGLAVPA